MAGGLYEQNFLLPVNSFEFCPTSGSFPNSFIQDYFGASRLHHLSRWKEELQTYAAELMKDKIAREDSDGRQVQLRGSLWELLMLQT